MCRCFMNYGLKSAFCVLSFGWCESLQNWILFVSVSLGVCFRISGFSDHCYNLFHFISERVVLLLLF